MRLTLVAVTLLLTAAPAVAGNVGSALRLVPADSEVVLAADIDRVRKSKLFTLGVAAIEKRGGKVYKDIVSKAGFNLRRDLETALVSLSGKGDDDVVLILGGRFKMRRIRAVALKDGQAQTSKYRGVEMIGSPDAMIAMVRRHLVAGSAPMVKKAIDASKGKRARRSLMKLLRKQPNNAGVVFGVLASGVFGADLKTSSPAMKDLTAMHGWMRLAGGGAKMSLGMDFSNGKAARKQEADLQTALQSLMGSAGGLGKALSVSRSGRTARLNGDFDANQLRQLMQMLGSF